MNRNTEILSKIIDNVEKVIVGKRRSIELMVISLICGGHVLIEDVPGVGKTTMVSSLARSLNLDFKRIQFTPDILPTDITGLTIYDPKTGEFRFHPGAVMTNILLADEINRTSPKTQSSLLEVMEEKQVTVDGNTYKLSLPFMVLATQNPIEYVGTFPLPEAQLDRFFMKIKIGYPTFQEEMGILSRFRSNNPLDQLNSVADADSIISIQQQVKDIHVDESIHQYIIHIVRSTRNHNDVALGVSPRGSLALLHASQAWALYQGRDYVIPDDVKLMVLPVLAHRMILKPEASLKDIDSITVLESILNATKVPIMD
ncbi:AAA family ATPase [Petroclostridium xylanilyticum]|uniref:AAA family ATPase n=1 Tax=Petroclostridium xylanilyticum TaxID=1792311 RepID=UPI001FA870F1|nr:MoxR family ATPase [Petroclostridium xylanilyticum]